MASKQTTIKTRSSTSGTTTTQKRKSESTHKSPQESLPSSREKTMTSPSNSKTKPASQPKSVTPVVNTAETREVKREHLNQSDSQQKNIPIDEDELYSNDKWYVNNSPKTPQPEKTSHTKKSPPPPQPPQQSHTK